MAYNEQLAARVRKQLARSGAVEKKMFVRIDTAETDAR